MKVPDWTTLDDALEQGGAILAAAYLGPPKFAMHTLIKRYERSLILTNTSDMPAFLHQSSAVLLDPRPRSGRSEIMVRRLLQLRSGGLFFGAPDGGFSDNNITIKDFGRVWSFSPGMPALAKRAGVPAFLCLVLWHDNDVELRITSMPSPDADLPPEKWNHAWIEQYWDAIAEVIRQSPENLRFLAPLFRKEFGT